MTAEAVKIVSEYKDDDNYDVDTATETQGAIFREYSQKQMTVYTIFREN